MALNTEQSFDVDIIQSVEENEWNRLKEYRLKEGFADGALLGKNSTYANGFYHGYKEGFGTCYTLNLIRGLLFANKLLLKGKNDKSLLGKEEKLKLLLDKFEARCNQFKLNSFSLVASPSTIISNDEVIHVIDGPQEFNKEKIINDDENQLNEISLEFDYLRKEILSFLNECQQPLLFKQISEICEKWNSDHLVVSENITKYLKTTASKEALKMEADKKTEM